jgi:deferrochelatase/peroxidase EfeB
VEAKRKTGRELILLPLEMHDIQGDLLAGMQKNAELFLFFRITDARRFKDIARRQLISRVITARTVNKRERGVARRRAYGGTSYDEWIGINLGFTKDGLTQLLGENRPRMEAAFERGADAAQTVAALHDPDPGTWIAKFRSDRIDGVFLIAGRNKPSVTFIGNTVRAQLSGSIKIVYSEIGTVRPGKKRRREHFGFVDGISQPGIRGLNQPSCSAPRPTRAFPGKICSGLANSCLAIRARIRTTPKSRAPSRHCRRLGRATASTWCSGG